MQLGDNSNTAAMTPSTYRDDFKYTPLQSIKSNENDGDDDEYTTIMPRYMVPFQGRSEYQHHYDVKTLSGQSNDSLNTNRNSTLKLKDSCGDLLTNGNTNDVNMNSESRDSFKVWPPLPPLPSNHHQCDNNYENSSRFMGESTTHLSYAPYEREYLTNLREETRELAEKRKSINSHNPLIRDDSNDEFTIQTSNRDDYRYLENNVKEDFDNDRDNNVRDEWMGKRVKFMGESVSHKDYGEISSDVYAQQLSSKERVNDIQQEIDNSTIMYPIEFSSSNTKQPRFDDYISTSRRDYCYYNKKSDDNDDRCTTSRNGVSTTHSTHQQLNTENDRVEISKPPQSSIKQISDLYCSHNELSENYNSLSTNRDEYRMWSNDELLQIPSFQHKDNIGRMNGQSTTARHAFGGTTTFRNDFTFKQPLDQLKTTKNANSLLLDSNYELDSTSANREDYQNRFMDNGNDQTKMNSFSWKQQQNHYPFHGESTTHSTFTVPNPNDYPQKRQSLKTLNEELKNVSNSNSLFQQQENNNEFQSESTYDRDFGNWSIPSDMETRYQNENENVKEPISFQGESTYDCDYVKYSINNRNDNPNLLKSTRNDTNQMNESAPFDGKSTFQTDFPKWNLMDLSFDDNTNHTSKDKNNVKSEFMKFEGTSDYRSNFVAPVYDNENENEQMHITKRSPNNWTFENGSFDGNSTMKTDFRGIQNEKSADSNENSSEIEFKALNFEGTSTNREMYNTIQLDDEFYNKNNQQFRMKKQQQIMNNNLDSIQHLSQNISTYNESFQGKQNETLNQIQTPTLKCQFKIPFHASSRYRDDYQIPNPLNDNNNNIQFKQSINECISLGDSTRFQGESLYRESFNPYDLSNYNGNNANNNSEQKKLINLPFQGNSRYREEFVERQLPSHPNEYITNQHENRWNLSLDNVNFDSQSTSSAAYRAPDRDALNNVKNQNKKRSTNWYGKLPFYAQTTSREAFSKHD